jgi:hypothetical protein
VVWPTRDGDDTTKAATSTTAEVAPSTSTDTTAPTTTTTTTTTTTAATTPSATTSTDDATTMQPQPAGNAGPGCVNGWIVPSRGSRPRVEPLDIICQEMGITGPFQVIEMR